MTFPAPEPIASDDVRVQFAADIGLQLARLDAEIWSPESFLQSADRLQRVLGRVHAAVADRDYLDFRRHLVVLVAECYRTARDRQILTDQDAVAATDAAKA